MKHLQQLQENIEQHRFFVELDDKLRSLVDADEIALTAATCLGRYLKAARCGYADVSENGEEFNLAGNYVDGVANITGRYRSAVGIGLALVKSLVEQHGGRVAAHSDGPGHGSRFTVHLPRLAAPAAPLPDDSPAAGGGGARRILVVDDNVDAAQMVAMLLQVLGNEVTVEYDPLQALASARETAFDAFILDIGLPGMDGHELARQIRALPSARGALFIALTGYGQEQDREDSRAAGFHYHFVKPADVNALSDALARGVPE